jgi:Tfp pilus assembly protein PilN
MTGTVIVFVSALSLLLGVSVLVALLPWLSQSRIRPYLLFTLYGSSVVVSMLGLLLLGNLLGCWLTTCS